MPSKAVLVGSSVGGAGAVSTAVAVPIVMNHYADHMTPEEREEFEAAYYSTEVKNWGVFGGGGKCKLEHLEKVDLSLNEDDDEENSLFKEWNGDAVGCAEVTWRKTTNTNNRWKGFLKIELLLKQDNEAILLHNSNLSNNGSVSSTWKAYVIKDDKVKYATKNTFNVNVDLDFGITQAFNNYELYKDSAGVVRVNDKKRSWGFAPVSAKACEVNNKSGECNFDHEDPRLTKAEKRKDYFWVTKKNNENVHESRFRYFSNNWDKWWNKFIGDKIKLNGAIQKEGAWKIPNKDELDPK